jgi:hypothetical protein
MIKKILFALLTTGLMAGCSLDKKLTGMSDQMNKVSASAADMDSQLKKMSEYTKELVDIMKKLIGGLTNPGGGAGTQQPPGGSNPGPIPPGPIPGNSPIPGNEQQPIPGNGPVAENPAPIPGNDQSPIPGNEVASGNLLSGKIDLSTKPLQELQDIDAALKQVVALKLDLDKTGAQPDATLTAIINNIEIAPPQANVPAENQALIVEISSLLVQLRGGQQT